MVPTFADIPRFPGRRAAFPSSRRPAGPFGDGRVRRPSRRKGAA